MSTFDRASDAHPASALGKGTKAGEDLKARAERIGGLEAEVRGLNEQAKAVKAQIAEEYTEAKDAGYNPRVLRQVIRELAMAQDERQGVFDFESEVDTYRNALGIQSGAEIVVEEMTDNERFVASVLPGSDKAKAAIDSARVRAEKKLKDAAKANSQRPLEVVK